MSDDRIEELLEMLLQSQRRASAYLGVLAFVTLFIIVAGVVAGAAVAIVAASK